MSMKHFRRYLVIAFVGLGIFNGISTWVEGIVVPRGFSSGQAGIVVAVMLVAGVIGAVVIPALSDRAGKRRRFIIIGLAGAIPGLVGIALAQSLPLLLASSFVLGFFLVSVNPVGTQYATDIALPTPEGSSNGLIALAGQISVVLVYAMEPLKGATGSYTLPLLCLAVLLVGTIGLAATLKEPSALRAEREEGQQGAAPTPGQAPNRI
jgi:MFS family permease